MFRYITAILLIAAFAAQAFQQGFIELGYFSNTASFANNCVNKARPKMHCNGKCRLMKKLAEAEKKNEQAPEQKGGNKVEVISSAVSFAVLPNPSFCTLPPPTYFFGHNFPTYYPASIFHPPTIYTNTL